MTTTAGASPQRRPATAEELASRPVRFAIIGVGGMGSTHARNLATSPDVEVTWLCDLDIERAQRVADDIGGNVTADIDEALAADDVDVALIALPTALHRMGVEKAAKAAKHVFCEKPIARTNEDAREMVRICEEAGVTLMVGHVVRFFSEYMRIKEELDAGTIGDVAIVRGSRLNPPVMERSPWFADVENSGGVVLDLMIHEIDTFRWLFGDVERLYAHGLSFTEWHTKRDHAVASIRFRNGVIAHCEASWAHSAFRTSIEVAGSKGLLRHHSFDSATLTFEPSTGITYEGIGQQSKAFSYMRPTNMPPHLRELVEFVDCLRTGKPVPVPGEEGVRTLAVANAVLDSMREHRPIYFNEDGTVDTSASHVAAEA
jgi:UDP-N-acetylglucosamine 3-dehydrogenase